MRIIFIISLIATTFLKITNINGSKYCANDVSLEKRASDFVLRNDILYAMQSLLLPGKPYNISISNQDNLEDNTKSKCFDYCPSLKIAMKYIRHNSILSYLRNVTYIKERGKHPNKSHICKDHIEPSDKTIANIESFDFKTILTSNSEISESFKLILNDSIATNLANTYPIVNFLENIIEDKSLLYRIYSICLLAIKNVDAELKSEEVTFINNKLKDVNQEIAGLMNREVCIFTELQNKSKLYIFPRDLVVEDHETVVDVGIRSNAKRYLEMNLIPRSDETFYIYNVGRYEYIYAQGSDKEKDTIYSYTTPKYLARDDLKEWSNGRPPTVDLPSGSIWSLEYRGPNLYKIRNELGGYLSGITGKSSYGNVFRSSNMQFNVWNISDCQN